MIVQQEAQEVTIKSVSLPSDIHQALKEIARLRGLPVRDWLRRHIEEDKAAYCQEQRHSRHQMSLSECERIITSQGWVPVIQQQRGNTYLYARLNTGTYANRKPLKRYICAAAHVWTLSAEEIIAKLYDPII